MDQAMYGTVSATLVYISINQYIPVYTEGSRANTGMVSGRNGFWEQIGAESVEEKNPSLRRGRALSPQNAP